MCRQGGEADVLGLGVLCEGRDRGRERVLTSFMPSTELNLGLDLTTLIS